APSPGRARAPGRRARRACAGASAPPAARRRGRPSGRRREARKGARPCLQCGARAESASTVDLVLFLLWCFAVALAGGLVGLVLGNLRLPATLLVASGAAAGTGANLVISAAAAASASIAHIRARRGNWTLFAWMAPPSIAGVVGGGDPRGAPGLAAHRPALRARAHPGDRRGPPGGRGRHRGRGGGVASTADDRAPAGDDARPPAADPVQHREPAGQRARRPGVPRG